MSQHLSRLAIFWAAVALFLGMGAIPGNSEPPPPTRERGIDRASQATIGVLQTPSGEDFGGRFAVMGSGFHLRDGYIVTARHAVEREVAGRQTIPRDIRILTTGLDELPARLIGFNAFLDLAVYRVDEQHRSALPSAAPFAGQEPKAGHEVFTVGYPLGWGPALGFGHVGNPNTFLPTVNSRLLQLDLGVCQGNSGGGLFNERGEVVGVMHAIIQTETIQEDRRCSRFAFAVPGVLAERIVTALIRGEQPTFSKLGLQLTAVKIGTRWRVAVERAVGPARKAGLREGDIILAIEDTPIIDAAHLKNYLIEHTVPGQDVKVTILRDDSEHVLTVTLGEA